MSKITRETQRERALSDAASLVQLLRRRASQHPSKRAYTFLAEEKKRPAL